MTTPRASVKSGDGVRGLASQDRGKEDSVLRVLPEERRVIVEGVNVVKRHQRPTRQVMQGGIIEKEAPVHLSNVMLVCPRCGAPTRTSRRLLESGRKVR